MRGWIEARSDVCRQMPTEMVSVVVFYTFTYLEDEVVQRLADLPVVSRA